MAVRLCQHTVVVVYALQWGQQQQQRQAATAGQTAAVILLHFHQIQAVKCTYLHKSDKKPATKHANLKWERNKRRTKNWTLKTRKFKCRPLVWPKDEFGRTSSTCLPVIMLATMLLCRGGVPGATGLSRSESNSLRRDPRERDSLLQRATTFIECCQKRKQGGGDCSEETSSFFLSFLFSLKGLFCELTFHLRRAWKFLKLSMLISLTFLVFRSVSLFGWIQGCFKQSSTEARFLEIERNKKY